MKTSQAHIRLQTREKHEEKYTDEEVCTWNKLVTLQNFSLWLTSVTKARKKYRSEKMCVSDSKFVNIKLFFPLVNNVIFPFPLMFFFLAVAWRKLLNPDLQ